MSEAVLDQANSEPSTPELTTSFTKHCERRYVTIDIGGGEHVRLRSLTAGELEELRKIGAGKQAAAAIAFCVVDANGHRTHTNGDIDALLEMDARVFDTLSDAINTFCLNQRSLDQMVKNYS